MKRDTRWFTLLLGFVVTCTLLLRPKPTNAYAASSCDGEINEGMQDNELWYADSSCMSAAMLDVIHDAEWAWNSILGVHDRFQPIVTDLDCNINLDDSMFQIAFLTPAHPWLEGNRGIAKTTSAPCFWPFAGEFGDGELLEADVFVSDGLPLTDAGELSATAEAHFTLLHELGHTMGMDHANEFSVMKEGLPRFRVGRRNIAGSTSSNVRSTSLSCEDARFAVAWHGQSGNGRPDVYVSPWHSTGTSHARNNNWTVVTHPGWWVNVNLTLGNRGKASVPYVGGSIVLSTNTTISTSDIVVRSINFNGPVGTHVNATVQFFVPSNITAGIYHVGFIIDDIDLLTEDIEHNNASLTGAVLDIHVP